MRRRTVSSFLLIMNLLSLPAFPFKEGFYLKVPYIRQVRNYCGPAALASVFRYWKHPVDQYELASEFRPFPRKGLSGAQLKQLATKRHFLAYSFVGSEEVLLRHLRKGRPLILALSTSELLNLNHYVILVGWDEDQMEWILHDPADGAYQRLAAAKLLEQWSKLDNWTLLVVPDIGK